MQGVKTVLTDKQLDYLVRHFKDTDNEYLAMKLGISETVLHRFARRFGLKKTRAHMRQMQRETAAAAKASHLAHGTYPPKGYIIPRSEEFRFKKGESSRKRWGRAKERRRIEKAAASRRETVQDERMRVRMGLPQLTKMKVTQQPKQQILEHRVSLGIMAAQGVPQLGEAVKQAAAERPGEQKQQPGAAQGNPPALSEPEEDQQKQQEEGHKEKVRRRQGKRRKQAVQRAENAHAAQDPVQQQRGDPVELLSSQHPLTSSPMRQIQSARKGSSCGRA
jgi:hypothetical protein